MGLKAAGANLLLKGGFLNRTNYIGVLAAAVGQAAPKEFTDTWYARFSMALADWTRSNAGLAENTAAANFASPTANAAAAPAEMGIWTAKTAGTLLLTQAYTGTPAIPATGASFGWDAGMLELTLGAGAVTGRGLRRAYESGLVSGNTYLGLFQRDPSKADPGSIDDRVAIAAAGWTATPATPGEVENNAVISFGVQNPDPPRPVWVGLYDALTGGNLLWYDQLDVAALDPALGATISVLAKQIGIGFRVD